MSAPFLSKNAQFLAQVQSGGAGVPGTPSPSTDGVRVYGSNPIQYSMGFNRLDTDYAQASVSNSSPLVSPGLGQMKVSAYLTPAGTAGDSTTLDWATLMQGCAMQVVNMAADKTGTATAGSSTNITLASSASSVDGFYIGQPIVITGGTGAGQRRVIRAYTGSTKIAGVVPSWATPPDSTSTYTIPKNTTLSPVTNAMSLLTLYGYQHSSLSGGLSRLRQLQDAMGTFSLSAKPRSFASCDFTFSGVIPGAPTDVSKPAANAIFGLAPQPIVGAQCYLGAASGGGTGPTKIKFSDFTLDAGLTVAAFDDPSAAFGYDSSAITLRDVKGTMTLNMQDLATRANAANIIANTQTWMWIEWGAATGQKVGLFFPAVQLTDDTNDDTNGFQVDKLSFDACGTDNEYYICVC